MPGFSPTCTNPIRVASVPAVSSASSIPQSSGPRRVDSTGVAPNPWVIIYLTQG